MKTTLTIKGLHCPACKKLTEKRIGSISGVTSVNVNPDTEIVEITADQLINKLQVEQALSDTAYTVT